MTRPFDPDLIPEPEAPSAYTVSEINQLARELLERNFRSIHVVGEVSNLHLHRSGHVYFTLKDGQSQLDAVMWKGAAGKLAFEVENGMEVLAFGELTIYTRGGRYQLVARLLEVRGAGALEVAFRQLMERLEAEGLFDEAHKKALPFLPRRIALVTSPQGAAVRDMMTSIFSRFSRATVAVFGVKVQGQGAANEIAQALDTLNRAGGFDLLVIGRGGGSLEDLWAFNEEAVARAVFRSAIPVVSAVGHERDLTISDLVADARAMTPTEVGFLVMPDEALLAARLARARDGLVAGLSRRLERAAERLAFAWRHPVLRRPEVILGPLAQRCDIACDRLQRGARALMRTGAERLARSRVKLESLSPLSVLSRGYSITLESDGRVLKDASKVAPGEIIETILANGSVSSEVTGTTSERNRADGQKG